MSYEIKMQIKTRKRSFWSPLTNLESASTHCTDDEQHTSMAEINFQSSYHKNLKKNLFEKKHEEADTQHLKIKKISWAA